MRSTLTLAAATLATLALAGCTQEPHMKVLPEALPTVSSAIKQTTITAPTPTKTTPTIAALASYECRDANPAEVELITRGIYGHVGQKAAVDLGEGWSIVAFREPLRSVSILTNGKRFAEVWPTTTDFSTYFDSYVFEGAAAARDAAFKCLT